MKRDALHFSFSEIDGYNKPFNLVISPREDGKTTDLISRKARNAFEKDGRPTILLRRYARDIDGDYIKSLETTLNLFAEDEGKERISLYVNKGDLARGIARVYADKKQTKMIFYVIAINLPLSRLKSRTVGNPAYIFFDEVINDPKSNERYVKNEAFVFKEIYNTYYRGAETAPRCYLCGNPYSWFSPYFMLFGIDGKELASKGFLTGPNWVAQYHSLNPELKRRILAKNPLYEFGQDDYRSYALDGVAVEDKAIEVVPLRPEGYTLIYAFRVMHRLIGIYAASSRDADYVYWAGKLEAVGGRRQTYAFDFDELQQGAALLTYTDRLRFQGLKWAMAHKSLACDTIETGYILREVYKSL